MELFRIIRPSPVLAPFVRHYWILESDDVHSVQRIIPSGNVELVFHRANPMMRSGELIPHASISGQSLSYSELKPTGLVNMIAVVFNPYGAKAFFDIPVSEFSNRVVSAEDSGVRHLSELEDKILSAADDDSCIRMIESFLMQAMHPLTNYNYDRMVAAVGAIDLSPEGLRVGELAGRVCLSEKQFRRVFSEHVGLAPKEFMRIVRFHKALFTLQNNQSMNFTCLACECGYYDQSHLIAEFKLFSGYTPGEYISVCAPYSDYFS